MRSGCRAAAFEPGREYKFIKMSAALNNFGSDLALHHNLVLTFFFFFLLYYSQA